MHKRRRVLDHRLSPQLESVASALRERLRADQVRTGRTETNLYRRDASNMSNPA